jgi:catechol 2,3-dioxygenase-like lactoylglutathione lyase family enzyme
MDARYLMSSYARLLVADRGRSLAFYQALGFERIASDPVFVHLRWARHADLFLVATPPGAGPVAGRRGVGVLLCWHAGDRGLDAIAARAEQAGGTRQGPTEQPWMTRELIVEDPDGYRLVFVEPR